MGAKETYQIGGASVEELTQRLNFVLNRIADRFDQLEGNRGNPTFRADLRLETNKITGAGAGSDSADGVVVSQILDDKDAPTVTNLNVLNNVNVGGSVITTEGAFLFYDANGELIHSFGDES